MKLSICIPSYNRFDKLTKTVESILHAKSIDFEVVIIDNTSTMSSETLNDINDHRLKIIKRSEPVSGIINCTESMLLGTGDYCLLLLDKDRIYGENLDEFINELYQNRDIMGGWCIQNKDSKDGGAIIESSILKNIFPMRHPSGYFVRKDILYYVLNNVAPEELMISPYGVDYFITAAAMRGSLMIFDKHLVDTEKATECRNVKSYTYSAKKSNLFFAPKEQIRNMLCFLSFLEKISENKELKSKIANQLFVRFLKNVTLNYRNVMKNENICTHYCIKTEQIGILAMFKWGIYAFYKYINSKFNGENKIGLTFAIIKYLIRYKIHAKIKMLMVL